MTSHTGSEDPYSRLHELRTATIHRAASLVKNFDGIVEATSDVATERRLGDGLYGTCTICGLEIAVERLDALPATPTCIHCAR